MYACSLRKSPPGSSRGIRNRINKSGTSASHPLRTALPGPPGTGTSDILTTAAASLDQWDLAIEAREALDELAPPAKRAGVDPTLRRARTSTQAQADGGGL